MSNDYIQVGERRRFWLGPKLTRIGKIIAIDDDGLCTVKYIPEHGGDIDWVCSDNVLELVD